MSNYTQKPSNPINEYLNTIQYKMGNVMFFNPKVSSFKLDVSLSGMIQLSISNSLVKNLSYDEIQKHTGKRYDHEGTAFYSINAEECCYIARSLNALVNNTFENPNCTKSYKPEDPKYKKMLTITHFIEGQPSKMILEPLVRDDSPTTIRISLIPPRNGNAKPSSYLFRPDEFRIFAEFVKKGYTDLPYHQSLVNAVLKLIKQAEYEKPLLELLRKHFSGDKTDANKQYSHQTEREYYGGNSSTNKGGRYQQNQSPPPVPGQVFIGDDDSSYSSSNQYTPTPTSSPPSSGFIPLEETPPPKNTSNEPADNRNSSTILDDINDGEYQF